MQIFVYMLLCADGSYYVGLTRKGLDERFSEHVLGHYRTCYTYSRRPVKLVWSEQFVWLKDAIACERQLKGWRRAKKEALVRRDYAAISALSKTARKK